MVEQQYRTFGRRAGALLLDRLPLFGLEQTTGLVSSAFGSLYFGLAWGQLLGWAWIAYLLILDGEICPGYQVDVAGHYLKLAPLTLGAAMLGAVLGAVIGWPRLRRATGVSDGQLRYSLLPGWAWH